MRYVDLSENFLGYSDAGKTPLVIWCLSGSSSGAGWCPTATPLSGTVSKLTTLDISDNGFAGGQCSLVASYHADTMLGIFLGILVVGYVSATPVSRAGIAHAAMVLASENHPCAIHSSTWLHCPPSRGGLQLWCGFAVAGALPSQWPLIFTKLQYFYINSNAFTASSAGLPSALPSTWTRPTIPAPFPDLANLMLYPGNDQLCFLPDGDNDGVGFADVAPGEKAGW